MTEDEMTGWHHQHEFEQAPGVCDGQRSLGFCTPWSCKELDMTERLNNNNNVFVYIHNNYLTSYLEING